MLRPDTEGQDLQRSPVPATGRRLTVALAVVAALSGCSGDDGPAKGAVTTSAEAPVTSAEAPISGVESFCTEFADVVVQDDPDFTRLEAAAPEEVKPEVVEVVAFSEMAATAEGPPEEDVIEGFQRSVAGMTIYAVGNCDNIERVVEGLSLDQADLEVLRTYSLDDVRNDDTWPKVKKALGAS